jgi:hypothetical protein
LKKSFLPLCHFATFKKSGVKKRKKVASKKGKKWRQKKEKSGVKKSRAKNLG